jgi:ribosomal 50S subunit-associated protein YjgA (DUF615 family)
LSKSFNPCPISGNPAGRSRKALLSDALRAQIAEPGKKEKTIAQEIAAELIKMARGGDLGAIKEIFDRTEGKAMQPVSMDMNVMDWREMAASYGIDESDVISEAKQLIESAVDSGGE